MYTLVTLAKCSKSVLGSAEYRTGPSVREVCLGSTVLGKEGRGSQEYRNSLPEDPLKNNY